MSGQHTSHGLPSGDVAQVIDRALDALIGKLEQQKFGATTKSRRRSCRPSANPRHIPAAVRQAVWERDQGRCTFVGDGGHRCSSRKFLQYDHIDPVARGGKATVDGVRLLCSCHNQYEADRTFGAGFMSDKREQARRAAAEARTPRAEAQARTRAATKEARTRAAAAKAEARARAVEEQVRSRAIAKERARDVMAALCELGFRAAEARRAIESCDDSPDATLEERVRAALRFLCPKARCHGRAEASLEART